MANSDSPFGLMPVRTLQGSPYNSSMANAYFIAAGDATATFVGDLMMLAATGTANASAITFASMNGIDIGTAQSVRQAAASADAEIVGVVVGFEPNRDDLSKQYRVASTERIVYICDNPDMIYHIQESGNIGAASAGLNADITVGTGSTVSGKSAMELDSDTEATTATLPLRILQGAQIADNDVSASNAVWEVMINAGIHLYRQTTGVA